MATVVAGNTVKEDLVFGYDTNYGIADNDTSTRFYPGESTDNKLRLFTSNTLSNPSNIYRCTVTEQNIVDVTAPNGQYSRYTGIDGSSNNQVFYSYAGSGFNYTGQTITYSVSLKGSGTCHLTTYDDASGYGTSGTITLTNKWVRYSYTRSVSSSASSHWSGVRGIISSTDVYVAASQMEIKGHSTPFTPTTRSSTQSLIDLKSTTDIDVSNVSFDSNGQPEFDGTNDYIQNNSYTKHRQDTGTLEVVVRPTIVSGNRYVAGVGGTTTYGATRTIRINSGTFGIVTYGSSTQDWGGVATATANQYQHVVATWSGTSLQLYVNNVFYSATKTGVVSPLGTNLTVGRPPWAASSYYAGSVDIFKQYSQVLSPQQVEQNYNVYKNRFNI